MADELLLGGRYRLIAPLGRGDAGIVWRAHDLRLARDVAIKEVQPPYREEEPDVAAARRRALRKARAAARLSHPALLTVHDLLEERGRLWIVMELLEALSLKQTVRQLGPLPARWTAWIGYQLVGGLRHAHAASVLHRDIKPRNVQLTGNRVVLGGFGIATLEGEASSTLPAVTSPAYIAPERLRGEPATTAADMWAFGATLFYAVEGRPPYHGTTDPAASTRAGPLRPVLEGLLRPDPAMRLTGLQASSLLAAVLRREGVIVPSLDLTQSARPY